MNDRAWMLLGVAAAAGVGFYLWRRGVLQRAEATRESAEDASNPDAVALEPVLIGLDDPILQLPYDLGG